MSRVYFHSLSRDEEILGRERHYASGVVNSIFLGMIREHTISVEFIKKLLPKDSYLHQARSDTEFWGQFRIWASVGMSDTNFLVPQEDGTIKTEDVWTIMLNTALRVGNDPIRFFVRMHAQCEMNPYIEGKNRNWLAGIIEAGRKTRLYRPDMGWGKVVEMLKERDDEPVVLSFSVTDTFPSSYYDASYALDREKGDDDWYDLSEEERWRRCMETLRGSGPRARPEISPDDFQDYYFNSGTNLFTLAEAENAEYLRNKHLDPRP